MSNYLSLVEDQYPAPVKQPSGNGVQVNFH